MTTGTIDTAAVRQRPPRSRLKRALIAPWQGLVLTFIAGLLGAKPPRRVPAWLARPAAGEVGVSMLTRIRGSSNARAKWELGWQPAWPSWRQGFSSGLAAAEPARGAA